MRFVKKNKMPRGNHCYTSPLTFLLLLVSFSLNIIFRILSLALRYGKRTLLVNTPILNYDAYRSISNRRSINISLDIHRIL